MFRVGIIGAGHISVNHIRAYQKLNECEVAAICDLGKEVAQSRADEYEIKDVYTDYKDILNDSTIDAVSIVTPTFTHKNIVIDAMYESAKTRKPVIF